MESGSCRRPITSKGECGEAARQLELTDTTAWHENESGRPPYCHFSQYGKNLKFNKKFDSTKQCTVEYNCICKIDYKMVTSGNCERPITSKKECEEAGTQLGITDTEAGEGFKSNSPPYCYMHFRESKGYLKFNKKVDSTKECTVEYNCICK